MVKYPVKVTLLIIRYVNVKYTLLIKYEFIIIRIYSADIVQFQSKTLAHLRDLLVRVYFASKLFNILLRNCNCLEKEKE